MSPFKLLTLAMATAVTASTFYPGPSTPSVNVTTIATTTTVVKGPATEQPPIITSSSATEVVTSIVTSASLPPGVPADSSTWVQLSSWEAPAQNTTDVAASSTLPSGASSTIIVTQSTNGTYHSATASGSATSTAGPVSAGEEVKVGAVVGLAALVAGILSA